MDTHAQQATQSTEEEAQQIPKHAAHLRNLRKHFGQSQQQFAEQLNLSRAAVARLERGETVLSPLLFERVSKLVAEAQEDFTQEAKRFDTWKDGIQFGFTTAEKVLEVEIENNEEDNEEGTEEDSNEDSNEDGNGIDPIALAAIGLGIYLFARMKS